MLQFGDDRADGWVEVLQDLLVRRGWPCGRDGTDGVDGRFGINTLRAVRGFQEHHGIQEHDGTSGRRGVVGTATWSALRDGDDAPVIDLVGALTNWGRT